ncbi:class I SAM-dependent methyltransferase [Gemmatimonadota bacterium]
MPCPVREKYPEVFSEADSIARECPVEMGGPGNVDLLYWLAEHREVREAVETGVAFGWSSLALLLSMQHRASARLYSSDMPYPERENDAYVGCVVPAHLRTFWQVLRYADRDAIPRALRDLGGTIDLCHYDSDKSYEGRMWAYPLLWRALRPGGFFISDDISDNVAFRDFAAALDLESHVVETDGKYVGLLVKPPGD